VPPYHLQKGDFAETDPFHKRIGHTKPPINFDGEKKIKN
jgi:hypothetical protein